MSPDSVSPAFGTNEINDLQCESIAPVHLCFTVIVVNCYVPFSLILAY